MEQILVTEKKYLDFVEKVIEEEIKKGLEKENAMKKESTSLSFEDRLRGTHFNLNSQLFNVGENIAQLERAKNSPYFGRIDYQNEFSQQPVPIYVGRTAISQGNTLVVYDWRSPICGLYYDSEIGPVSYSSPNGIQNGNLVLKRQILIKNAKLLNAVDSNLVTNDELLLPYLNVNADSRMKTIIASIQKEQNAIIRAENNNMIVQGVAGSGKTSVALHRIAYLMYNLGSSAKSNKFLVIGPNDYFLNYVSSVLPELETTPVEQKTLIELMNFYVGTDLTLEEEPVFTKRDKQELYRKISSFKGSSEYRHLLDKFIQNCLNGNGIVSDDFKIDDKVIFSREEIRRRLVGDVGRRFDYNSTYKYYKTLFREKKEDIYDALNEKYRSVYISLPKGDPKRNEYMQKSEELRKKVKDQGEKLLEKYFKSINKSCLSLYVSFISELSNSATSLLPDELRVLQKETLKSIRKKHLPFEDIPSLLYLNYCLTGKQLNYTNVVIDEAQDYGVFTFSVLRNIFRQAKFNIYGDIAQSIYPYRSVGSWDELNRVVFDNECQFLELSKSYRTTIEITEAANNILTTMGLSDAQPVIRHGTTVGYDDISADSKFKSKKINEWLDVGYQTIAVICKEDEEAQRVQKELADDGIISRYISKNDDQYTTGVFVLSVASAKGLEFDCTIINDASSTVYDANSDTDMHLLYVASTRALHEQVVLYNKDITKPFKGEVQKPKVLTKQCD